ncbi:MAG: hypothetical protein ACYSWP_07260 [Planctomycetota bacterium]|jgi:hypothetical protein
MALGYEGYVSLKVNTLEDVALGQGGGVPKARQRLESSSGYGGEISTPVADMGIGLPRNYDWTVYDGSMDFDVHEDFLTNQVKAWVFARQDAGEVYIQTRQGNVQDFDNCYWNNISLSASEGGALTGSISFVAMQRDSYTRGGDYINNKTGGNTLCAGGTPDFPDQLNPLNGNINPIPFWNTFVEINGSLVEMTTWNLDFSQEVVKFFGCFNNATVQEPKYVAVGPMTVSFTGDYMFVDTATFASPDTLSTLYITMGGEQIKLEDLELTTDTDSLQGQDAIVPVSLEYAAYTLVA